MSDSIYTFIAYDLIGVHLDCWHEAVAIVAADRIADSRRAGELRDALIDAWPAAIGSLMIMMQLLEATELELVDAASIFAELVMPPAAG